jgi:hypothetical protein
LLFHNGEKIPYHKNFENTGNQARDRSTAIKAVNNKEFSRNDVNIPALFNPNVLFDFSAG